MLYLLQIFPIYFHLFFRRHSTLFEFFLTVLTILLILFHCKYGLHYIDKQYVVAQSGGTWTFTASVTSGVNNGEIVCWVEQIY